MLEERGREWQQRFGRVANDLPPRRHDPAAEPIHEVELWDLVSAFGRILRETSAAQPANIRYDDTPIHVYMRHIHEQIRARGRLGFTELLNPPMHRSTLMGLFLAVLELVRHHGVRVEQDEVFAEIWIVADEARPTGRWIFPAPTSTSTGRSHEQDAAAGEEARRSGLVTRCGGDSTGILLCGKSTGSIVPPASRRSLELDHVVVRHSIPGTHKQGYFQAPPGSHI